MSTSRALEDGRGQERCFTFHPLKVYPTEEAAVARFRLIPEQPCDNPYIIDYIARDARCHSVAGGYAWKFDPAIFARVGTDEPAASTSPT